MATALGTTLPLAFYVVYCFRRLAAQLGLIGRPALLPLLEGVQKLMGRNVAEHR